MQQIHLHRYEVSYANKQYATPFNLETHRVELTNIKSQYARQSLIFLSISPLTRVIKQRTNSSSQMPSMVFFSAEVWLQVSCIHNGPRKSLQVPKAILSRAHLIYSLHAIRRDLIVHVIYINRHC